MAGPKGGNNLNYFNLIIINKAKKTAPL